MHPYKHTSMHVEAEDEGGDGGDDGMDGWVEEGPAMVSSTDLAVWLTRSGLLQRVARHCLVPLDVNLHFHIYIHYVSTYIYMHVRMSTICIHVCVCLSMCMMDA